MGASGLVVIAPLCQQVMNRSAGLRPWREIAVGRFTAEAAEGDDYDQLATEDLTATAPRPAG
jgi:hypothetical protein